MPIINERSCNESIKTHDPNHFDYFRLLYELLAAMRVSLKMNEVNEQRFEQDFNGTESLKEL